MMELNREQIIKMLETIDDVGDCSRDCIFYNGKVHSCGGTIAKHALALIKELAEENEFHRKTISENAQMALNVTIDEIEKARAEIVQKFADYLKKKSFCCDTENWMSFDAIDIDELDGYVKEFLEENK